MIISSSEKSRTKKPFLNRFEKYDLSHKALFREALLCCQGHIKKMMTYAKDRVRNYISPYLCHLFKPFVQVKEFVEKYGKSSFYGLVDQTIESLLLSVIPSCHDSDKMAVEHVAHCECYSKQELFAKCLQYHFQSAFGVYIDLVCTSINICS